MRPSALVKNLNPHSEPANEVELARFTGECTKTLERLSHSLESRRDVGPLASLVLGLSTILSL